MRELVTTLLDTVGLLLIAAGITAGLWTLVGGWGLCPAGAVIIAGSWLASRGEGE